MSSFRLCTVPTSCPRMRSKARLMGFVMTQNTPINTCTNGTVRAPMYNAYREQAACGTISPKITMRPVETRNPTVPLARSAMKMERPEFTATLPKSSVQSSWFPDSRMGAIFDAYCASSAFSPFCTICKPRMSKPMRPSVSPENKAEKQTSTKQTGSVTHSGQPSCLSSAHFLLAAGHIGLAREVLVCNRRFAAPPPPKRRRPTPRGDRKPT
mmetsp:Transcript_114435/g.323521  ORF Transcript_114435/g.323521 Transcript_114435/m.323521 type:complete len:212 (+) Transcript_114435:1278-1913(+)